MLFTETPGFGLLCIKLNVPCTAILFRDNQQFLRPFQRRRNQSHVIGIKEYGEGNGSEVASYPHIREHFHQFVDVETVEYW